MKKTHLTIGILFLLLGIIIFSMNVFGVFKFAVSFMSESQLPVCEGKGGGGESPAISIESSYWYLNFVKDDINSGKLCEQIIGLENIAPERTKCSIFWIDESKTSALLNVSRTAACRDQFDKDTIPVEYFFALVSEEKIFDFKKGRTYFEHDKFPVIDNQVLKELVSYIDQYPETGDVLSKLRNELGSFVFYYGQNNDSECGAFGLPEEILEACLATRDSFLDIK